MILGRFFDARSSASQEALLAPGADGNWVIAIGEREVRVDPAQVQISDRLGSVPRRLRLPDGAEFETTDNDGIDGLLGGAARRGSGFVDFLERRWGVALASLAAVVLISAATVRYGLPALSGWAATQLPPEVDLRIGTHSLEVLDRTLLNPSRLSPQRQSWLLSIFARMTADLDDGHHYRLEFRSGKMGPNAFALPSGIIVLTDELVDLAEHDEELMAVLAHEIGHVRGRHALRQIIQSVGVSALAMVVLGDVSSISALATAAPVLIEARNSRELEIEADGFSRDWLTGNGIAAERFDNILCRMMQREVGKGAGPGSFLSTHPAIDERARCMPGGKQASSP